MRLLLLVLIALVGLIQYPLWMGRGGWFAVWDMQEQVASQRSINDGLRARNAALAAEVEDLRSGTEAAEERARGELGMIRSAEVFVQILPPEGKPPESKVTESRVIESKTSGVVTKPASPTAPGAAKPAQGAAPGTAKPQAPAAKPPAKPQAKTESQTKSEPGAKPANPSGTLSNSAAQQPSGSQPAR